MIAVDVARSEERTHVVDALAGDDGRGEDDGPRGGHVDARHRAVHAAVSAIGAQRGRELMGMDKKVLGGRVRLVLMRGLGRAAVPDDYAEQALEATLQAHFG